MRTGKGIILVLTIILMVCFSAAALAETSPVTDGEFNFDVDVLHDQTPSGPSMYAVSMRMAKP